MRVAGIPYVQGRNDYTDWDGKHFAIAIHNTSNNASDSDEASYARRRTDGTSAHLYVDHDSVTQSLSLTDRAGHAGSEQGNDNAIAVEITGANGWSREKWLRSVAWDKLGRALAWIIRNDPDYRGFQVRRASVAEMRRNPRVKAFYSHDDMRRAWGGTDHTDPGPHFPWDRLFKAVNDALKPTPAGTPQPAGDDDMPTTTEIADAVTKKLLTTKLGRSTRTVGMQLQDLALAAAVRDTATRLDAILRAVAGDDSAEILARLDALAADMRERDEAEVARDAELRTLVQQGQDGTLDAAEVVQRIGELLAGQQDTA